MSWRVVGDWGTSRMRLYKIEQGKVIARSDGPGIGQLSATPAETLRAALAVWSGTPPSSIDLCGAAGSRGGLHEVGYVDCPAGVDDWRAAISSFSFDDIPLRIAPGFACTDSAGRPDVMRGEETQIFGALASDPGLATAQFILPGTHSKWVRVGDGCINAFHTCPSGELYAILRDHSTLLAGGATDDPAAEATGFGDGLDRAATGAGLVGTLFETRAMILRAGRSASWGAGYLSGLVIGNEIADSRAAAGLPQRVLLIGAPALAARYAQALAHFGVASRTLDGDACVLKGLELLDAQR